MATRYLVGDAVALTNTFTVDDVETDPTTVTLQVTDPSGDTATYSYAEAEITKESVGVYSKVVTAAEPGTWTFLWTGTGAAADVQDGTFDVWSPASTDLLNLLTLGEAYAAVNIPSATGHDDQLRQVVTAVSRRVDALCGPVVVRDVVEYHEGGQSTIWPYETPVSAVTSVTEWDGTTETVLTEETFGTALDGDGFRLDQSSSYPHGTRIFRRSGNGLAPFRMGRVEVAYEAGRFADTASVDARFKTAASAILRRLWDREAGAWSRAPDPFDESLAPTSRFFNAVDHIVKELLTDQLRLPGVA